MSLREEDRRKTSCSGTGLGIAAAAIGVGVGAALYYFFSKRPEQPDTHGATTSGWDYERPHTLRKEDRLTVIRQQAFRERRWSIEECSICFEVMLKDQDLMSLPCTHNFHTECILPWLQEKQTCPNCRKTT